MIHTLIVLFSFSIFIPMDRGQMQLSIENIKTQRGSVLIAVFDNQADFENEDEPVYGEVISKPSPGALEIKLPDLPYGTYAVAVYHDINDNRKLDRTRLGIPKEPYAFSNNPKAKWSPATFEDSKVKLNQEKLQLTIELKAWNKY
jgi:uncharacterized protein (DUF2141 family)